MYRRLSGPMILAAAALLSIAYTASAATVGPVTDDLGVIRIAKGAPIQIGAYWVLSGADTALGLDEKRPPSRCAACEAHGQQRIGDDERDAQTEWARPERAAGTGSEL